MTKIYTGVGSRKTTAQIAHQMQLLGNIYGQKGYTLRSGKADGADSAFQYGFQIAKMNHKCDAEIYIPWFGFNNNNPEISDNFDICVLDYKIIQEAEKIVAEIHPAWGYLKQGAKKLHIRNVFQVLGSDLNKPSDFLLYYAEHDKYGKVKGGTATAVNIAKKFNVPVYYVTGYNTKELESL